MFQRNFATMMIASAVLLALPAFSQTEGPARMDVAVQASGSFVATTTQNGVNNSASDNGGVLGTYRYFFNTHSGVEVNYGYALNTQKYSSTSGATGVDTNTHEVSGAYVFRLPYRNVTPFALAGAGALVFNPKNLAAVSTQTRGSFVYGAGVDFRLTHGLFLRAEYRGFVYDSPTYSLQTLSGFDRLTHRAEPSVGFGYSF